MDNHKLWDKYHSNLLNQGLTKQRISKLNVMFNIITRHLTKSLDSLNRNDIEDFLDNLNKDKYTKKAGTPGGIYSASTKADIKKFLRQFFKWHKGNGEYYPKEVSWIKTRIPKDQKPEEKQIFSIIEVKKIAYSFKKLEYRIMVLLLFDSGFRINELFSVRKSDISFEEFDEKGEKCFWIACNNSKTYPRKIPVPMFTEDLQVFFNSTYYESLNDSDYIFSDGCYHSFRIHLRKKAKLITGKDGCVPHALRHSSATYYAMALDGNMNMLADRYGWSYSSSELKTYIRRSGAYQKQSAKKIYSNKVLSVERENESLKAQLEQQQQDFINFKKEILKRLTKA